jgi:transitional endoplasmic reticulum ATPase
MRRRHFPRSHPVIPAVTDLDKSQRFMKKKLALYADRLLGRQPRLDRETLETLHWLIGPDMLEDCVDEIRQLLTIQQRQRFDQHLGDDVYESHVFATAIAGLVRGSRRDLENTVTRLLRKTLNDWLGTIQYCGTSEVEKSLSLFKEIFSLSDLEIEICLFLSLLQIWDEAQRLFEYHLGCHSFSGRNYLATILNASDAEIALAINGKLTKIGILENDRGNTISLEASFHQLLNTASHGDLKTEFFTKIDPNPVPLDAHMVEPLATQHLLTLLGARTESSTHVLLYGPPGTGKTSYALGLAKELGLPVYLVEHAAKDRHWRRQFAFTACVNMAVHGEGSIVLADDSDLILGTRDSWSLFGESSDKRWLHDLLETPGVRMIWTVNSISQIEESVARRFSFSLGFKPFSTTQRMRLWDSILEKHDLGQTLDASQIKDLATKFQSSPGVIEQSVRKATETGCHTNKVLFAALNLSLEAHETLTHGGTKPRRAKLADPNFTLEGLNVGGTDLRGLIEELKAYTQHLKRSDANDGSTMALLFHGPSGTGKSHLARHLALELDKEVVFKRGSDLLSMWVGGTEQNIKGAYEEATAKDAILVFDEADSLIFTRDRAVRSWEISHTNEFLTWMEQFRGIQIFTTNRLSDLDNASLRRFNHKIEFRYLKPDGNITFYKRLLLPLVGSRMTNKIEAQLRQISRLAPGDFKVVRDRFKFKNPIEISHDALLAALREEAMIKSIQAGEKAIGF